VEALEEGAGIRDAEAKITILETENANLKVELQALKTEVEAFRAERKQQEQEKKREEIPEIQYEIVKWLPSQHGGNRRNVHEIAHAFNVPVDETEIHIDRLQKAGLIEHSFTAQATVWCRSMKGNVLVLAKRLAGDEKAEQKPKQYKRAALSIPEQLVLLKLVGRDEGVTADEIVDKVNASLPTTGLPTTNLPLAQLLLIKLREKKMATDGDEPDYGTPRTWVILKEGLEYLAERNLL
jgi:hypothetical protein